MSKDKNTGDGKFVFSIVKKNDLNLTQKHVREEHKNMVDAHDQTLLHVAAYMGYEEICQYLIDLGFDPNARDKNTWTPLHSAAGGQERSVHNLRISAMLLKKGAGANATTSSGATSLHYLVRYPYSKELMDVVKFIIMKGGNVDPRDDYGETPLHQASFRGCPEVVDLLVLNGAGLSNMNAIGEVPLHLAARSGKKQIVETLLRHDADPEVLGPNGTAKDIAFVCNHQDIVDILDKIDYETENIVIDEKAVAAVYAFYGGSGKLKQENIPVYEKSRVSLRLQDANFISSALFDERKPSPSGDGRGDARATSSSPFSNSRFSSTTAASPSNSRSSTSASPSASRSSTSASPSSSRSSVTVSSSPSSLPKGKIPHGHGGGGGGGGGCVPAGGGASLPPPLTESEAIALLTPRNEKEGEKKEKKERREKREREREKDRNARITALFSELVGSDNSSSHSSPSLCSQSSSPFHAPMDGPGVSTQPLSSTTSYRPTSFMPLQASSQNLEKECRSARKKGPGRFIVSHPEYNQETGCHSEAGRSAQDLQLEYTNEHDDYYFISHFVHEPAAVFSDLSKKCGLEDSSFVSHIHLVGTKDAMRCLITLRLDTENGNYRGIMRTAVEDTIFWLYGGEVKKQKPEYLAQAICTRFPDFENPELVLETITLSRLLIDMDLVLKIQRYKFGVIYVPDTPESEDDLFSTREAFSPEYLKFLDFLGNKIRLKDWKKYRGDLDVKNDGTGTHAYHRDWHHLEIIFQVGHMLPEARRKAIVGNTISTIIFQQKGQFNPSIVVSQVLHAFVVVQPVKLESGESVYRLGIATKKGVPRYRPSLPRASVFRLDDIFREVLMTKLVNGERASYHCSTKVRSQKRSLVELTQHTRKGQMEYSLSHVKFKPLKVTPPKRGSSYLEHVTEKPKQRSRAASLIPAGIVARPKKTVISKTDEDLRSTHRNSTLRPRRDTLL